MKKLYFFTILIALCVANSCSKFLDKEMLGAQTLEAFFLTKNDAVSSVTAAYSDLKDTRFHRSLWSIGDVLSDNCTQSGSDGDVNTFKRMESFDYHADFGRLTDNWRVSYSGINRACQAIDGITAMEPALFSKYDQDQLIGEAKFLRAYFHFILLRNFGAIPVIRSTPKIDDKAKPREPVEDVYAFIEQDLIDATQKLKKKSELGNSALGRATRGAALALLSKVYLYEKKYDKARDAAKEVIDMGETEYRLNDDFSHNFDIDHEHGVESIFEIDFYKSPTETANYLTNGNYSSYAQMPRPFAGYGGNQALPSFVGKFDPSDKRLKATFLTDEDLQDIESASDLATLQYNRTGYYNRKQYLLPEDRVGTTYFTIALNIPIIRLAEVYLIYAEACVKTNDNGNARLYLNKVRKRAGLAENLTDNGDDLYEKILLERRFELAMEGDRFYDLIRTGKAAQAYSDPQFLANPTKANAVWKPGKSELLPIPQTEIDNSNGSIVQNPI
ncbi:MAG: RagB/SusD family nutrient uptake outer membrane protein [Bacteroidia bacterium]|nr:RagB/SusD family nutrient uptake outer membrane protein [Bacteroidia bacterium]